MNEFLKYLNNNDIKVVSKKQMEEILIDSKLI